MGHTLATTQLEVIFDLVIDLRKMPVFLPGELPPGVSGIELKTNSQIRSVRDRLISEQELFNYDIMLRDTRSESYRDAGGEGSLFVKRAPQEIRSPADTGVSYHLNETNRTCEVSLNDAPQRPEYEWNSVQLETRHDLCEACIDVLNYYCWYRGARSTVSTP